MRKDITVEEVWVRAWCATASAANCRSTDTATRFADSAVEAFKNKFPHSAALEETSQPPPLTKKGC